MRILILKPSSLGDVVQALPVLRLLKLHYPASEIHWWIDSNLASLLEADPDLTGLFLFQRRRWSSPLHWDELAASIRKMRCLAFDWVIDLQSLMRSALVAWLTNGGLTIGLDDPREGAAALYDIAVPRPSFDTHAVDWYLRVLPHLSVPVHWDFDWLPPRADVAASIQRKWTADQGKWIALQPGARWVNKRWPAEYFAALVQRLLADAGDARFVVLGGESDAGLGAAIAATAPKHCLNLAGRTTLPEMIEWVRFSRLMITNDTGPMHVAAALGKPVVALFGPTEPRRTGPYGQIDHVIRRTDLPCVPCMKDWCAFERPLDCLRGLPPSIVCEHVAKLLSDAPRASGMG